MKEGTTLNALAEELTRQNNTKLDMVAPLTSLRFQTSEIDRVGNVTNLRVLENSGGDCEFFRVNDNCHQQIGEALDIPRSYYKRMLADEPGLLDANVNRWLERGEGRRLVRTLDGTARAFLSDRYRRIDNFQIAMAVLPEIQHLDGKVESCELTDTKMYIKVTFPHLRREVKSALVGDIVEAGLIVSNSEIGKGVVEVQPLIHRLACLNGLVIPDAGINRRHVGRNLHGGSNDEILKMYADDTIKADDQALMLKVRDTVRNVVNEGSFAQILEQIDFSSGRALPRPALAVERLTKSFAWSKEESGNILEHLTRGGDLSQWGLINAITRSAQDVDSYDRSTELETQGGQLLQFTENDWRQLVKAN